jgi:DNA-binding CsgD family transcriptional regulator
VRSGSVRFDQARRLIRLVREAHEVAPPDRAHHLVMGVRRIVGAATAGCVLDVDFTPTGRGESAPVALDGWDDAALQSFAVVAKEGSTFHPAVHAMMKLTPQTPGAIVTATRDRLVDDRSWYGSPFVEGYLARSCLDNGLFSSLRGDRPNVVHGLGLYREKSDKPFSEADRALVQLFHVECARMLRGPASVDDDLPSEQMPPRERCTLRHLLEGLADKEIAERMSISRFTVNQYTKALYRRFGVRSRAALIAKFGPRRAP